MNPSVVITPDTIAQLRSLPGNFVLDGECVGEVLHAFDLLSWNSTDWTLRPYRERWEALWQLIESADLPDILHIETAFESAHKLSLLACLKAHNAEGIVFKQLQAPYTAGRPATAGPALKLKFTATASFIVAAVNAKRSVTLRLFDREATCGNVTIPPNHQIPGVAAIVEVRYLYAYPAPGSLFQPVYLGQRDDVDAAACTESQLKFKPASRIDKDLEEA